MANVGYVQVTRLCNQDCRFCSNPDTGKTISFQQARHYIDNYQKKKYACVFFTGGEPTLCPELAEMIAYAAGKNIEPVLITNGQRLSDKKYLFSLRKKGLKHIMLSVYSCKSQVQAELSNNPDSFSNIVKALDNLKKTAIRTDILTTINKYNANHLSRTVKWLIGDYPFISHFVWNNLDPLNSRVAENPDTIPRLNDFELELHKSMDFLSESGRTFRIERVPLCYMTGFEHFSTETRRIVKSEERAIYFLDKKRFVKQKGSKSSLGYVKANCCNDCWLNELCAGLYGGNQYYSLAELYPVFVFKDRIINKVLYNK